METIIIVNLVSISPLEFFGLSIPTILFDTDKKGTLVAFFEDDDGRAGFNRWKRSL